MATSSPRVAGRVGREESTDVLAGIDRLVSDGIADPDRLGIARWSHGGFLAAWAAGQTGRFRPVLAGAAVTDGGMLAATGENGAFEAALGGSTGWSGLGPHPHDALSPVSFASRMRTPILLRVPAKLVGNPAAGDAEVSATTSWRAPDRFQVCEGALHRLRVREGPLHRPSQTSTPTLPTPCRSC
ncbi:alpha/beta hydrolase family protein [Amycolatopsis sulphurea]